MEPIAALTQLLGHVVTVEDGDRVWPGMRLEGVSIRGRDMQLGGFYDTCEIVIDLVDPWSTDTGTSLSVRPSTRVYRPGVPPPARRPVPAWGPRPPLG